MFGAVESLGTLGAMHRNPHVFFDIYVAYDSHVLHRLGLYPTNLVGVPLGYTTGLNPKAQWNHQSTDFRTPRPHGFHCGEFLISPSWLRRGHRSSTTPRLRGTSKERTMKVWKILLCGLVLAVPVFANETDDRKTATSLKYVAHELDTRQNKLETGTNQAITYTNLAGGVEQRTVKSDLAGGSTSDTSLPTVSAVTDGLSHKQDEIEPINDHTAVTYTGQTGEISTKGIYQSDGTYADQSDALIDAKTFNAALKNGLDGEFVCDEDNKQPGTGHCWLWKIHNNTSNILPPEYTQLEYLQSSGTQYINTGYVAQENDVIEVDYELYNLSAIGDKFIIGAQPIQSLENAGFWVETYDSHNAWYVRYGSPVSVHTDFYNSQTSGTFVVKKGAFFVNGVQILSPSFDTMSPNPLTIFGRIGRTGDIVGAYVKISRVNIKEGNALIHQYIPARRNRDDALGMYDTVSREFFENVGTDDFIAGPSVSNNIYIPQNR